MGVPASSPPRRGRSEATGYPRNMSSLASTAVVLDGTAVARTVRQRVAEATAAARRNPPPGLRVLLVGDNPASQSYVGAKTRAAQEAGIQAETVRLPADISADALPSEVE